MIEIWAEVRPDVIVIDNVIGFPAVSTAGVPWVRMVSANPLEMDDPGYRRCSRAIRRTTAAAGTSSAPSTGGCSTR